MKRIQLTNSPAVAIVDDEDYHWLSQRDWLITATGYAYATSAIEGWSAPLMHRLILLALPSDMVDHINRHKLDNRRSNLRLATQSEQNQNRDKISGSSKYRGVYPRRDGLKWVAQASLNNAKWALGGYDTEEEAAFVYDYVTLRLYGEKAHLNHPVIAADLELIITADKQWQKVKSSIVGAPTPKANFVGVRPKGRRWEAYVSDRRKYVYLGCFDTEMEAKAARDASLKGGAND